MNPCPCCGQPLPRSGLFIDLDSNSFGTDTIGPIRVEPQMAEVLHILHAHSPKAVAHDRLVHGIYGGFDPPLAADNILKVQVSRLRRVLRETDTPYVIETMWGKGFRLVPKGFKGTDRKFIQRNLRMEKAVGLT
jgi:DNA-binding response OmpR family regulator